MGLLKYVGFINDEMVKIQRFLSGMPTFYKENIRYDEPKTLTEAIVGPWLWKEARNKEEKVKSELRRRHSDCHWVELRKRVEKME